MYVSGCYKSVRMFCVFVHFVCSLEDLVAERKLHDALDKAYMRQSAMIEAKNKRHGMRLQAKVARQDSFSTKCTVQRRKNGIRVTHAVTTSAWNDHFITHIPLQKNTFLFYKVSQK